MTATHQTNTQTDRHSLRFTCELLFAGIALDQFGCVEKLWNSIQVVILRAELQTFADCGFDGRMGLAFRVAVGDASERRQCSC
jgi:hypothetical protein